MRLEKYCFYYGIYHNTLQDQLSSVVAKKLKCIFIHHKNPYLRLGPFRFEQKYHAPEIAILHEFLGKNEVSHILKRAEGNLKSTPFIDYDGPSNFSKERTSKIMYLNELFEKNMLTVSKKIEMVTQTYLKNEACASENYQIMNYGLGGKISPHVDSIGRQFQEKDNLSGTGNYDRMIQL